MIDVVRIAIVSVPLVCGTAAAQRGTVPLDTTGKQGELELHFVDAFGAPVGKVRSPLITLDPVGNRKRLIDKQPYAGKITQPYGRYRLLAQYSGGYPVEREVEISSPSQTAVMAFFVAPIELPWAGNTVRGQIVSAARLSSTCRILRLISAVSQTDTFEVRTSSSGHFAHDNVRPGEYIGIVFGDEGICGLGRTVVEDKALQDLTIEVRP